jgi:hypothetical protein
MMNMEFITEFGIRVVHVLASINVEVLLLLISDLEHVFLDVALILTDESTDNWVVVLRAERHEGTLDQEREGKPLSSSPSEC